MKTIEIEAKYELLNDENTKKRLVERLNEEGKKISDNQFQKDTYYVPKHNNFLNETPISKWLRVRETENNASVNYKDWSSKETGKNNQITCKELETTILEPEIMHKIFLELEFKEIAVVEKRRSAWEYKNIIISIDTIENLGTFIELEFKTNEFETEKESLEYIEKIIDELSIEKGKIINKGYPQLVLGI